MSQLTDFQTAVIATPDDWVLRSVYADFLEEQGLDILSRGQRFQSEHKKRPLDWWEVQKDNADQIDRTWRFLWGNESASWSGGVEMLDYDDRFPCCMIPSSMFKEMHNTPPIQNQTRYWRYYLDFLKSEEALANALEQLRCKSDK